jgi:hypothetical protein
LVIVSEALNVLLAEVFAPLDFNDQQVLIRCGSPVHRTAGHQQGGAGLRLD